MDENDILGDQVVIIVPAAAQPLDELASCTDELVIEIFGYPTEAAVTVSETGTANMIQNIQDVQNQ